MNAMFSEASKRGVPDRSPKVTFSRQAHPERPAERVGLGSGGIPGTEAPADTMASSRMGGGHSSEQPGDRPAALSKQPDRLSLLEAQMKTLQKGISRSTEIQYKLDQMASHQQKQTREWEEKQGSLNGQLCDVQEECRRLRDACSQAERKVDERQAPSLNRASSVQGFTTNRTFSSEANLSSLSQHTSPIANSTLLTSKHLSTSNTSLDSVKSTQSLRDATTQPTSAHLHRPAGYRSTSHASFYPPGLHSEGKVSTEELEKANSKIRQLQREVVVLEQQLADKSRSARSHVEEVMKLRTSLTQEKASLAMAREDISARASSEASRLKALHAEKVSQLEGEVERLRRDKTGVDQEIGQLRADLKVSQAEKDSLGERVDSLVSQLDQERSAHEEAMRQLQSQIAGENSRVQRLEEALQECQKKLVQHMNTVTEADQQHRGSLQQVKGEIASLSADLAHTRQQLAQKSSMVSQLERDLSEVKASFDEQRSTWQVVERELKDSLEESEGTRLSLMQQLEQTGRELAKYTGWLGESQQVSSELRQCRAELSSLQKSLVDVQRKKEGLEQSLVVCQQERQSQTIELGRVRRQLEQATSQLSTLEGQAKSKLGLQEELSHKLESAKAELEGARSQLAACRAEVSGAEAKVRQVERESEEALESLQQELSKRTQQVLEMDGMLRSHQADVTARRLQLERTLAQRQADLKARTQELEELSIKYSDAQKVIEQLRSQVIQSKSAGDGLTLAQDRKLEAKAKEVHLLQEQLREATLVTTTQQKEVESLRTQLEEKARRDEEMKMAHSVMEAKGEELQRQCDHMRQDHIAQVQQLQDAHASLITSREQLASSHRLQLQHLSDQERLRQEELSRCRAQVASLSAELAAERKVNEDTRQQLAAMRSGQVYNQLSKTRSGSGGPLSGSGGPLSGSGGPLSGSGDPLKGSAVSFPRDDGAPASRQGTPHIPTGGLTDFEVIPKVPASNSTSSYKGKVLDL